MTHLATYARLPDGVKALLAELEERRRARFAGPRLADLAVYELLVASDVDSADYLIRAATGDVLADDDVRLCMELALEEVG